MLGTVFEDSLLLRGWEHSLTHFICWQKRFSYGLKQKYENGISMHTIKGLTVLTVQCHRKRQRVYIQAGFHSMMITTTSLAFMFPIQEIGPGIFILLLAFGKDIYHHLQNYLVHAMLQANLISLKTCCFAHTYPIIIQYVNKIFKKHSPWDFFPCIIFSSTMKLQCRTEAVSCGFWQTQSKAVIVK